MRLVLSTAEDAVRNDCDDLHCLAKHVAWPVPYDHSSYPGAPGDASRLPFDLSSIAVA
jgi:hypothetical protein